MIDSILEKIKKYIMEQISQIYKDDITSLIQQESNDPNLNSIVEKYSPLSSDGINMMLIQTCLYFFSKLEEHAFIDSRINARELLIDYLYSKESLDKFDLIINPKNFDSKNKKVLIKEYQKPVNISISIRNLVNNYLIATKKMRLLNLDCKTRKRDSSVYTIYNLPIHQIPTFLLLFTYYDGRESSSSEKLSPKVNPYSEQSFINVLNKIDQFYDVISNYNSYMIHQYSTVYFFNKFFHIFKLKQIYKYHHLYTSDDFMALLSSTHTMTYREMQNLKEFVNNNIFKDTKFISAGLRSNYLDFFIIFHSFWDILLNYHKTISNYGNLHHEITLAKKICNIFCTKDIQTDTLYSELFNCDAKDNNVAQFLKEWKDWIEKIINTGNSNKNIQNNFKDFFFFSNEYKEELFSIIGFDTIKECIICPIHPK